MNKKLSEPKVLTVNQIRHQVTGETFNSAQNMVKYFESCSPVVPKITPGRNPAEYMLECIGAGTGSGAAAPQASVDFAACYAASPMARETSIFLQEVCCFAICYIT
jgi:hypothetical protein